LPTRPSGPLGKPWAGRRRHKAQLSAENARQHSGSEQSGPAGEPTRGGHDSWGSAAGCTTSLLVRKQLAGWSGKCVGTPLASAQPHGLPSCIGDEQGIS
jgi:hypothetical protein